MTVTVVIPDDQVELIAKDYAKNTITHMPTLVNKDKLAQSFAQDLIDRYFSQEYFIVENVED